MKPQYLGLMVVLHQTTGGLYLLVELDGSVSQLCYATFHLIPYYLHLLLQKSPLWTRAANRSYSHCQVTDTSPNPLSPFSPLLLPMLSFFPLRLSPHSPQSSTLSVLLFYCRTLSLGQSLYVFLLYPVTNQRPLPLYRSVLFLIGSHCCLFPFIDATYS